MYFYYTVCVSSVVNKPLCLCFQISSALSLLNAPSTSAPQALWSTSPSRLSSVHFTLELSRPFSQRTFCLVTAGEAQVYFTTFKRGCVSFRLTSSKTLDVRSYFRRAIDRKVTLASPAFFLLKHIGISYVKKLCCPR